MTGADREGAHAYDLGGLPAGGPAAAILVEGLSDRLALDAAARQCGRDLDEEGVVILPMGGATNLGRHVAELGPAGRGVRLAGLCDLGEARFFGRTLERLGVAAGSDRAAMAVAGFFVCERDLEDELIRALGPSRVEAIIAEQGELGSLRTLQQMPFHRGRPIEDQLRRFMGVRSGRKHRYAPLLAGGLAGDDLPRPIRDLLAWV